MLIIAIFDINKLEGGEEGEGGEGAERGDGGEESEGGERGEGGRASDSLKFERFERLIQLLRTQ